MTQEAEALIAKLSPGRAGKLPLVAGPLCLNFTNTASGRGDVSHQDHLQHYNDLLAWSLHAGALPIDEATELARLARRQPEAAAQVLRRAVALRESLHAIGAAIAAHVAPPPEAVADLDEAMTEATQAGRITWDGKGFVWQLVTHPPRLERPLWPILRSAGEVLLSAPLDRVKACAGQHCGWLFLDETRNGKRRWCEMEVCGSRAKMRRYRKRHSGKTA